MNQPYKIVIAGNPNCGKSSLFNALTGMRQRVGNFPGVTVDKKSGTFALDNKARASLVDLPGTYSLYPKSPDEYIAYEVLLNPDNRDMPDLVLVVADAANLKRSLLFCSQIIDLKYPVVLVLTMMDVAASKGLSIDYRLLQQQLGIPVVPVNPNQKSGLQSLKTEIAAQYHNRAYSIAPDFVALPGFPAALRQRLVRITGITTPYRLLHIASNFEKMGFWNPQQKEEMREALNDVHFSKAVVQAEEIMARHSRIEELLREAIVQNEPRSRPSVSERIDKVVLHKLWGSLILLGVIFIMFQTVFWLADYPMSWIETGFAWLQNVVSSYLPGGWWNDFIVNGLMAGIGGIIVFVPQITLLFGLITLLEDSGYMARISFLSDRVMRSAGLNGRSVMPLVSGMACAIPAVMSARTIENRTERLITIMVTPFMSCSARLPVYIILIALVIPDHTYLGFIKLQALVMTGMYLLGIFMALMVARVMSWMMRGRERSIYLMELPVYQVPRWRNALQIMYEKAKVFVVDAGKVIMVISLIIWVITSYGPSGKMHAVEQRYAALKAGQHGALSEEQEEQMIADKQEASYAGHLGKLIEPVIHPLGYDWKMGIALITSFAAREVFVGTMATLYSVGDADEDSVPLRVKMANEKRPDGTPVYTLATGLSLMVFYALAMQCMSTLAIVKRETKSWKWPLIQLSYMTVIAYVCSLIVYQVFK